MSKYRMAAFAAVAFSAASLLSSVAMAGEVVWWTPNWGQPRAEKLAADFQKANPGITIKLEITTSNGLPQRILTAGLFQGIAPTDPGWIHFQVSEAGEIFSTRILTADGPVHGMVVEALPGGPLEPLAAFDHAADPARTRRPGPAVP